ncbi:MAG: hypothetical protein OHK0039_21070 [Bacteroidia bacterium]
MLSNRFRYDAHSIYDLSPLQQDMVRSVEDKLQQGVYTFESTPCPICGGEACTPVAGKDRYGLALQVVVCDGCGLVRSNPRMTQQSYNQFYNDEYRKLYTTNEKPTVAWFMQEQRSKGTWILPFIESTGLLAGKNYSDLLVLEVGCGAGGIMHYFREKGFQTLGIDLGEEYIEFGRANFGLDLRVATLQDLELTRQPDIIIYSHVLEHILEPGVEMEQLKALMKPDTILYIEVPGIKNLWRSYSNDLLRYLQNAHVSHFSLTSLSNLMHRHGYERVAGNEVINSVFRLAKPGKSQPPIVHDREAVLRDLRRVERLRKYSPFVFYELTGKVKQTLLAAARRLGLYSLLRAIWRKIR